MRCNALEVPVQVVAFEIEFEVVMAQPGRGLRGSGVYDGDGVVRLPDGEAAGKGHVRSVVGQDFLGEDVCVESARCVYVGHQYGRSFESYGHGSS